MGRHGSDKSSSRRRRHQEGADRDERGGDSGKDDRRKHHGDDRKKRQRYGEDHHKRRGRHEELDESRDRKRHKKHGREDDEDSDREDDKKKSRKHDRRRKEDHFSDEEDRKSRKRHRKDKRGEERKGRKHRDKHRRDDDEDSRSRKKDKKKKKEKSERKRPENLISLGPPLGNSPNKVLSEDDYFAFHEHLWVFIYREYGRAFNDMTSEESREAFRDFVQRYNKGELPKGYYVEKLPPAVLEESKTTKHSWSFRMSETEGRSLQSIEAGVRKQTEYRDPSNPKKHPEPAAPTSCTSSSAPDQETPRHQAPDRVVNRRLKEHVRAAEEEFGGGRKEGRERQIEKRKETAARIHGAARERESAAGLPEMGDDVLYGGDDRQQFARAKKRTARRQESQEQRLTELQAKEKERQEAMFKQLGLSNIKPGEKITIQPRKDA